MHELFMIILVVNLDNMQMATVWDKNVKDAHFHNTNLDLRGSKRVERRLTCLLQYGGSRDSRLFRTLSFLANGKGTTKESYYQWLTVFRFRTVVILTLS